MLKRLRQGDAPLGEPGRGPMIARETGAERLTAEAGLPLQGVDRFGVQHRREVGAGGVDFEVIEPQRVAKRD